LTKKIKKANFLQYFIKRRNKHMGKRTFWIIFTLMVTVLCFTFSATAQPLKKVQGYPSRPIEVVNPHGPGAGSDIFLRALIAASKDLVGVPMNINYVSGAAGAAGLAYVADQPADGYTITECSSDTVLLDLTQRTKFRMDDVIFLYMGVHDISAIHVLKDGPIQSFKQIMDLGKTKPNEKITLAGAGMFGVDHVWIQYLNKLAGTKILFIPFDKGGERHASFLGKHVTLLSDEMADTQTMREAGKTNDILIGYDKRIKAYPNLPCTVELGINNTIGRWRGVAVKKGTPPHIVAFLEEAFNKAKKSPKYQEYIDKEIQHDRPAVTTSQEFTKFAQEEKKVFGDILKELGVIK
jgi:tripartite-type tricarboxylate transporter receptor subunit TctC